MKIASAQKLDIEIGNAASVSALLDRPPQACACFVFAHGAGAGMTHPFMAAVASGLGERGVATLRYQFPYMEKAASGRTRRRSRKPRCAPPWRKPGGAARDYLSSRAENRSAAA
jgi:predicted alpha/beta-hydrolase family hydrolase